MHEEIASRVREAEKKLKGIERDRTGAGLKVKVHIRWGKPTEEIQRLAVKMHPC